MRNKCLICYSPNERNLLNGWQIFQTVRKLETTDDINTVTDYFSYEHFYVIYCKFYELDKDHDLIINKIDISHHANGGIFFITTKVHFIIKFL